MLLLSPSLPRSLLPTSSASKTRFSTPKNAGSVAPKTTETDGKRETGEKQINPNTERTRLLSDVFFPLCYIVAAVCYNWKARQENI